MILRGIGGGKISDFKVILIADKIVADIQSQSLLDLAFKQNADVQSQSLNMFSAKTSTAYSISW